MIRQFRILCLTLCLLLLPATGALATKARSIETDADSAFHTAHLLLHLNTTQCHATGNYIKTRSKPGGSTVVGHLEQADSLLLLAVEDNWAKIEVTASAQTSPDSFVGMTGWINADYLDCDCSTADYYSSSDGYSAILDWFYHAIAEKWDAQIIVDAGFEPWEFPDDLNTSGYVYQDINSDGIDELFLLRNADAEIGPIIAGYTLDDGHPVRLFSSWARSRFDLRSDGIIYNSGSSGAAYIDHYIFDLTDAELVVREGVFSNGYTKANGGSLIWFWENKKSVSSHANPMQISSKEAEQRINLYQQSVIHRFDNYTSFAEYAASLNH